MRISLLLLSFIYYANGDHVFNWCKEYITFNMNSKSPTIVTESPTIVTKSPTIVTESPTIVTESPTIVNLGFPYIENESRTNRATRYWFYAFDRDEYYKRYVNQ